MRLKRIRADALDLRVVRRGRGVSLLDAEGRVVSDPDIRLRYKALVLPPAWTDVRLASHPRAHIQATGIDAAGRRQYRYHPDWETRRLKRKLDQLAMLSDNLGRLRRRVRTDLAGPAGSRQLALAVAVALIDRTAMRVGRERYLDSNGTRGAGTLFSRDVTVRGSAIRIVFPAKSGKKADYVLDDAELAGAISRIKTIAGARLLLWRDAEGKVHALRTDDINRYLREATGAAITAKDFRTLHASALAAEQLARVEPGTSPTARKRQMAAITRQVAAFLQNTPAVCRSSYIAPCLFELFDKGALGHLWSAAVATGQGLRAREARLAAVLAAQAASVARRAGRAAAPS
jgi:DNA topoisomerase-1